MRAIFFLGTTFCTAMPNMPLIFGLPSGAAADGSYGRWELRPAGFWSLTGLVIIEWWVAVLWSIFDPLSSMTVLFTPSV